jgi:hypothetical protein
MRALLNFCLALALLLAAPGVFRLAANDAAQPPSNPASAPFPSTLAPVQANVAVPVPAEPPPSTVSPVATPAVDDLEPGKGVMVAPVKRSKPVIPAAVIPDTAQVPLPVRKPAANAPALEPKKSKSAVERKSGKKQRVSGAQSKTKRQ